MSSTSDEVIDTPPPPPRWKVSDRKTKPWHPALNPAQQIIFDATEKFVLADGEKGSGKTTGCLHALVRHCYEEKNALALVIAISISVGKEGALYDLENLVLPAWRDGNKYPDWLNGAPHPKAGEYMDEGINLQYTNSMQDPDTKHRYILIENKDGHWSKIILISITHAEFVEARVKGPAPSFVYIEELTNCSSDKYFKYPSAQLGRRRDIVGPQQFYASCNPEGPSHWVYKTWFVDCVDEATGKRDPDFKVVHVPVSENIHRLPPGYVEQLKKLFKDNVEKRRLIDGEWVDRPSGDAIFKDYFMPEIHMKGDALKNIGWIPFKNFPIIVGYDPGPVNFSLHLLQRVITKEKTFWMCFDELNYVATYMKYSRVVSNLVSRMDRWSEIVETELRYTHVAPDDAFNQIKSDGSYDSAEIERLSNGRIRLRACPQAKNSVRQRVQMLQSMLMDESFFVSATCPKTLEMFRMLNSKKVKPGEYDPDAGLTPVRSIALHPFDSLTYPLYYFTLQPGRFPSANHAEVTPEAYACGSNR